MFKQAKLVCVQETKLKEHEKYLKITLEELMRHIRQIVSYICIQLFGGTMCITKMFMLICSNLYFVIFKSDTSMSPYFRRVTREEKESDVQWSSLDPSAPGPSHIMRGKSQKSSEGTLPPREENVRMKTVKTAHTVQPFTH